MCCVKVRLVGDVSATLVGIATVCKVSHDVDNDDDIELNKLSNGFPMFAYLISA